MANTIITIRLQYTHCTVYKYAITIVKHSIEILWENIEFRIEIF